MLEGSESRWRKARVGCFSASSLHRLMSSSGKFTKGNVAYLMEVQRERDLGRPLRQVDAKPLSWGRENEPYAIDWLRENSTWDITYYEEDMDKADAFFKKSEFYGCTPDAFFNVRDIDKITFDTGESTKSVQQRALSHEFGLIEIKCIYGQAEENYIFSTSEPYEDKKAYVRSEHGDQIAGQFLCFSDINVIYLLKYLPQFDDDEFDVLSPADPSRGVLFRFERDEFDLEKYWDRIRFADEFLRSGRPMSEINDAWIDFLGDDITNENKTE